MEGSELVTINPGQHLRDLAPSMIENANKAGRKIVVAFNEFEIPVMPNDTIEGVVERYFSLLNAS